MVEANVLRTLCVAYDVARLRDSVRNDETGLLVPNGDVEAFAKAIIKVLLNDGLREKLNGNAIEWAKQFNWDRTTREFKKILEKVVNK
jgi:glycosyltransferase involved in cell wall biosynthesis